MTWGLGGSLPEGWSLTGGGGFFPAQKHLHHQPCDWTSFETFDYALEPSKVRMRITDHKCSGEAETDEG